MNAKPRLEYLSLMLALILPLNDLLALNYSIKKIQENKILLFTPNKSNYSIEEEVVQGLNSSKGFEKVVNCNSNSSSDEDYVNNKNQHFNSNVQNNLEMTSSQGQGETAGFTISSTDGMVDKFTGDFKYSIPLCDVEGYPISLNYNSNVGMNSDASWVGLGWELSVGAINREMRGIPDEFNGEQSIERIYNQKKDETTNGYKVGPIIGLRILPVEGVPVSFGAGLTGTLLAGGYKNTYTGKSSTLDLGVQSNFSIGDQLQIGAKFGLGYSLDTKGGIGRNSSAGLFASQKNSGAEFDLDFSKSFNSRKGMSEKAYGISLGYKVGRYGEIGGSISKQNYVSYGTQTSVPRIQFDETGFSNSDGIMLSAGFKIPSTPLSAFAGISFSTYSFEKHLNSNYIITPAYGYLHYGKANNSNQENVLFDYNRGANYPFSENMHNLSFSFLTNDFFYVSASGISGVFRANRKDVGTVQNDYHKSKITGVSSAVGYNYTSYGALNTVTQNTENASFEGKINSGDWDLASNVNFLTQTPSKKFDNSVFFKEVGEFTPCDNTLWSSLGGSTPNSLKIVADNNSNLISV